MISALRLPTGPWRAVRGAARVWRPVRQPHAAPRAYQTVRAQSNWPRDRSSRYSGLPAQHRVPPPAAQQPGLPPPVTPAQVQDAVASRRKVVEALPHETYRVAGVTFENRQPLVAQLQRGQALALVREPTNPADPNAVAVQALDGTTLGYIPRDETQRFQQPLCFGAVYSAGQAADGGNWGFRVAVQPSLPPVQVLAVPPALAPYASLALMLSGPAWEKHKAGLATPSAKCVVTGAQPVVASERWEFDESTLVMRLAGFQAVSPAVRQVQYALVLPGAAADAAQQLAQLNEWREEDAEAYLHRARELQLQRSSETWRLDLGLLKRLGIPVPQLPQELLV